MARASAASDVPWVHVTEGTSHHQEPFLLRAAARGLARRARMQAILTTGRDRDPAELGLGQPAANVHLTRWLSHSELLPRCAAVVTTGGAQHDRWPRCGPACPLVVVPTTWDKPDNALRVVEAGVAVRLSPRRCTPEALREAVERLLGDPSYRLAAQRIAEKLAAAPGPAGAAALVAGLAGVGEVAA